MAVKSPPRRPGWDVDGPFGMGGVFPADRSVVTTLGAYIDANVSVGRVSVARVADQRAGCLTAAMTELLFSYGTLRQPSVQLSIFGRELAGRPDAIVGFDLDYVMITDPQVIATSGSDRHPMLRPSESDGAGVEGMVFAVSETELLAADDYEVDDYRRIAVPLRSGETAWVYVFAG